jgi:PAS domain S-box-containing protein
MELIFFIYGLAFFLLGFAILYYPKKESTFRLARKIQLIGWFGILHGINEWLDLMILIHALGMEPAWKILQLFTLPVSFLMLIYFGAGVISVQKENCQLCRFLPLVLMVLWGVLFLAGEHNQHRWDVLSRYVLCIPGAFLTGMGLLLYVPETRSNAFRLAVNLKIAGVAFVMYAFLAGLIVKDAAFFPGSVLNYSLFSETLGVPVQVFRSICAVVIAYNLIRVLEIFHFEMQRSLKNSEMRFRTVVNTAPVTLFIEDSDHKITFLEGKGLVDLGVVSADSIGKQTGDVFAELPQIQQNLRRVSSLGEDTTEVVTCRDHYYELFAAPLKDQAGSVIGAIGVVIDVTGQKSAQNELEKYRVELEKNKYLATIGALSTKITAEIADPLQASKISLLKAFNGLRKTIGAGDVRADIQDGLNKITAAIQTLNGFCEKANLQTPTYPEPMNLFEIVRRVLSVTSELADHAMVRITTAGADIFPIMNISSRQLEQILYNTLQKIIHAADGTHVKNVEITFSRQSDNLCMKFLETCLKGPAEQSSERTEGPIIISEQEEVEHDFGLSVLKGIIESYGGAITITRQAADSALYEIQLPLAG